MQGSKSHMENKQYKPPFPDCFSSLLLGMIPGALYRLSQDCTTELHPQPEAFSRIWNVGAIFAIVWGWDRKNMAATMGRGFLQLESEWSLSGTGTMVFQDTVNILGCGLQGKKGRKPKRMAGQAVWLCYVHLASAMSLPLSDGCQHSECLISYSW